VGVVVLSAMASETYRCESKLNISMRVSIDRQAEL
jgi:hypothetical protein